MNVVWYTLPSLVLVTVCYGLTFDRSVPIGWDSIPVLENEQGPFNRVPKENIQVTSIDKSLQVPDDKKSIKFEYEKKDFLPIVEDSFSLAKNGETETPRNVVLFFIDDPGQDQRKLGNELDKFRNFPVKGYVQSCRKNGNSYKTCADCEYSLRSNIRSLLSWAHRAKKIIGAVSTTNFSIPFTLGHNIHIDLIDLDEREISSGSSTMASTSPSKEGDGIWDILDNFSKIRIAFFRKWLKSLNDNVATKGDELPLKIPIPLQSNLLDTVETLKSISKEDGFVMVAAAPFSEIGRAIDLLENKISEGNTLLVVAGICSQEERLVPFFAHGPGSHNFYAANSIWDLPILVKKAVSGCQGIWCQIETFNPIWMSNKEIHRRVAREKAAKTVEVNSTSINDTTTNKSVTNDTKISSTKFWNSTKISRTKEPNTTTVNHTTTTTIENSTISNEKKVDQNLTTNSVMSSSITTKRTKATKAPVVTGPLKLSKINPHNESTSKNDTKSTTDRLQQNEPKLQNHSLVHLEQSISENYSDYEESSLAYEITKKTYPKVRLDDKNMENNDTISKASVFGRETTTTIISIATSFLAISFLDF